MQQSKILNSSFLHWGDLIADSMIHHWPMAKPLLTKKYHCREEIHWIMDRFVIFRAFFSVKEIELECEIRFARMQSDDDHSSYSLNDKSREELENAGMKSFVEFFAYLGSKYSDESEVKEWVVSYARIDFPGFDCSEESQGCYITLDHSNIAGLTIFDDAWDGPAPLKDEFLATELKEVYRKLARQQ